jgi:hypothetical protein
MANLINLEIYIPNMMLHEVHVNSEQRYFKKTIIIDFSYYVIVYDRNV